MALEILDCTLRDGGYYTQWDFPKEVVDRYINAMTLLPIDRIEIGYRSTPKSGYFGKYFYCAESLINELAKKTNKKLAIILDEKDVKPKDVASLLTPLSGKVELVRLAVAPKNLKRSLELCTLAKDLGFSVALNIMYLSKWNEYDNIYSLLSNNQEAYDYIYMVDSYGSIYPKEVIEVVKKLKSITKKKIGFHGHNNLELAHINTLTAITAGVDIVDSTVTGMGRGAGNLKTELLLTSLNAKNKISVEFNALSDVVEAFTKLQENYKWGTNLPYMVSGANSLPQKEVMEWVGKRYYSLNSIIRALTNQSKGIEDNLDLNTLRLPDKDENLKVLIVGGGPSIKEHFNAISLFLKENPSIIIIHASSKNANLFGSLSNKQYFCLVGNEGYRLEKVLGNKAVFGTGILPPYPRKMGTYIPKAIEDDCFQLSSIQFDDDLKNSHSAIAIQLAFELGTQNCFLVGYDGYSGSKITLKEQELFIENQDLFQKAISKGFSMISLTPTSYNSLVQNSVYSKIT